MRIFITREFSRSVMGADLSEADLVNAAMEMNEGLWDANPGGKVYKKRVALAGRGKRGGARTLVAFRRGDQVFFMYGFAKNQRANITPTEKQALKRMAHESLNYEQRQLNAALKHGQLIEIEVNEHE
jgi:hypothetical protein